MKKFTWADAKGKSEKPSDHRSGGHKDTGRTKSPGSSSKGRIDSGRVIRALASMPKSSGSMRDLERVLGIKAPDQRRSFKRMVTSMLESGELFQRGKYLTLPKGRHKEALREGHRKGHRGVHGERAGERTWTGKLSAHPDGYGFVAVPDRKEDFFLPQNEM
jgi:exoribonuclease R